MYSSSPPTLDAHLSAQISYSQLFLTLPSNEITVCSTVHLSAGRSDEHSQECVTAAQEAYPGSSPVPPRHNILIVAEVRLCAIPKSGSARSGQWAAWPPWRRWPPVPAAARAPVAV